MSSKRRRLTTIIAFINLGYLLLRSTCNVSAHLWLRWSGSPPGAAGCRWRKPRHNYLLLRPTTYVSAHLWLRWSASPPGAGGCRWRKPRHNHCKQNTWFERRSEPKYKFNTYKYAYRNWKLFILKRRPLHHKSKPTSTTYASSLMEPPSGRTNFGARLGGQAGAPKNSLRLRVLQKAQSFLSWFQSLIYVQLVLW